MMPMNQIWKRSIILSTKVKLETGVLSLSMYESFLAANYEVTPPLPPTTHQKDSATIKSASVGQREARELVVETYLFDGTTTIANVNRWMIVSLI